MAQEGSQTMAAPGELVMKLRCVLQFHLKRLMLGKIEGKSRKGQQRMR